MNYPLISIIISLDGYFNGIKAVVPLSAYIPEFPRKQGTKSPLPLGEIRGSLPTPSPFIPQPDYESSKYTDEFHNVHTCYLDAEGTIPAPDLYAYNGIVQGQPEAVIGSHNLLGIRDDICWDRFGRYGPYGLGYTYDEGGLQEGIDTESRGNDAVWAKTGKIDYGLVDWGDAQDRCIKANKDRFTKPEEDESLSTVAAPSPQRQLEDGDQALLGQQKEKLDRIAVVIRTYVGFKWTRQPPFEFGA